MTTRNPAASTASTSLAQHPACRCTGHWQQDGRRRRWDHYKRGFGNADGEYWLGLEDIFHLTLRSKYEDGHELRMDMEDFEGKRESSPSTPPLWVQEPPTTHCTSLDSPTGEQVTQCPTTAVRSWQRSRLDIDLNCTWELMRAFWYNVCALTSPNGVYVWGVDDYFLPVGVLTGIPGKMTTLKSTKSTCCLSGHSRGVVWQGLPICQTAVNDLKPH